MQKPIKEDRINNTWQLKLSVTALGRKGESDSDHKPLRVFFHKPLQLQVFITGLTIFTYCQICLQLLERRLYRHSQDSKPYENRQVSTYNNS